MEPLRGSAKVASFRKHNAGISMSLSYFAARAFALAGASLLLAACAYEVAYRPDYVSADPPPYIAKAKLLIVMPATQREFVYKGHPSSSTGDYTTLTIPMGAIVEEVATQVFGGCFANGVDFVESLEGQDGYVLAVEGDMRDFAYSYTKILDQGFGDGEGTAVPWIVPEIDIAFHVKAYNRAGETVLDKLYDSGVAVGASYIVTGRPAERINQVLHKTLQTLMLNLATDIRPLLTGACEVEEVARKN